MQVDYDPEEVPFSELLERAFSEHDPYQQPSKRQYQNIVFTETATQHDQLQTFLNDSDLNSNQITTRFESLDRFHLAEAYHQKFNLRGKRWITEVFTEAGYDDAAIRESPAAAKLNAHVAGNDVSVPFIEQSFDPRSRH